MLRAWQRWPTFSEQGAPKVDRCSKHVAHSPSARPAVGQVDVPVSSCQAEAGGPLCREMPLAVASAGREKGSRKGGQCGRCCQTSSWK